MLNRPDGFREPGELEEYCRGFQVFDKDLTGFIGVGQLRYSMWMVLTLGIAEYTNKPTLTSFDEPWRKDVR